MIATSILFLALLGGAGANAGGAPPLKAALRVTFWGVLAMALTAGVGALFGAVVGNRSITDCHSGVVGFVQFATFV